jgi:hypothetical protein
MPTLKEQKHNILKRLEFIEFQLFWEDSLGRKKLQDQFDISPQQATNDISMYGDACPENLSYDPRQRAYVATKKFRPRLIKMDAIDYLRRIESFYKKHKNKDEIWIDRLPPFDGIFFGERSVKASILKSVLDAIFNETALSVTYGSLSSGGLQPRILAPHAIAHDGHRWHMRAYDHDKNRFSDFVLSRISAAHLWTEAPKVPESDHSWNEKLSVFLKPDPKLDKAKQDLLADDYGMKDGIMTISVRRAMLFYALRHFGFNPFDRHDGKMRNVSSFHLFVENLEEVEACLGRRS